MTKRRKYRNLKTSKPGARERDNEKIAKSILRILDEALDEKCNRWAARREKHRWR